MDDNRHERLTALGLPKALGAILLLSAAVFLGCGSTTGDDAEITMLASDGTARLVVRDDVEVDIRFDTPLRVGKNTLRVSFPARSADLTTASAFMAAHGHGSPPPAIERDGDAFVVRDLVLFMSGRWELRLVMNVDSGEDAEAVVAMDVP